MDRKSLLSATSPDQNPTAGYVLSEIARKFNCHDCAAFESVLAKWVSIYSVGATLNSHAASSQLSEFIVSRINQDSPNTKYKCLIIIKVNAVIATVSCPLYDNFTFILNFENFTARLPDRKS